MVHTLRTIILPLMIFCYLNYVKMDHAGIFTQIRGHVRLHHRMIYVKRSLLWMIYADVLHYKYTLYVLIYRHFTVHTSLKLRFYVWRKSFCLHMLLHVFFMTSGLIFISDFLKIYIVVILSVWRILKAHLQLLNHS